MLTADWGCPQVRWVGACMAPSAGASYRVAMRALLTRPFRLQTWREVLYLLLGLPASVAMFTVAVTGLSVGGGMLITLIGIPILVATAYLHRALAWFERHRAWLVLGRSIQGVYRVPERPGVLARLKTLALDAQTWRDAGWMILSFPVGVAGAVVAITVWSVVGALVLLPFYGWMGDVDAFNVMIDGREFTEADVENNEVALIVGGTLLGVLLLPFAASLCAGLARGQAHLAELLLRPSRGSRRVAELTRSRAATVQAQTSELRRIERDLHDGAQARLVAVTMDLGLAQEKFESDPERARELVASAHNETREAIAELRRLVSGIAPAVLTDRGLDAALSSLVASCRIPVTLTANLPAGLPEAAQVAAYFVASEALVNVQKHSGATGAELRAFVERGFLVIEVSDNGVGGASAASGSGLPGLESRVRALDGRFSVQSPVGGPTIVRAEIPCGL